MTANCASNCAEQSTLAPTSTSTEGAPFSVGMAEANAGRSTPGMTPCTILAVAMTAPVLPAETQPCVTPWGTRRAATRMELLRLVRSARAALSFMVTCSLAWTTWIGSDRHSLCLASSCSTSSWRPTRTTRTL